MVQFVRLITKQMTSAVSMQLSPKMDCLFMVWLSQCWLPHHVQHHTRSNAAHWIATYSSPTEIGNNNSSSNEHQPAPSNTLHQTINSCHITQSTPSHTVTMAKDHSGKSTWGYFTHTHKKKQFSILLLLLSNHQVIYIKASNRKNKQTNPKLASVRVRHTIFNKHH